MEGGGGGAYILEDAVDEMLGEVILGQLILHKHSSATQAQVSAHPLSSPCFNAYI